MPKDGRSDKVLAVLAVALVAFTAAEVNYPRLGPQTALAIFATLGLLIAFHRLPISAKLAGHSAARVLDYALMALTLVVGIYLVVQNEPFSQGWWLDGQSLGNRAGAEHPFDYVIGSLGLLLVLEATRRAVGWALPVLAIVFLVYARIGPVLPDVLFPHRGYDIERIVSQTFLHSQGVFGTALRVMFVYVFLFVAFGALLEATGASAYVIDRARRLFGASQGGPAKVAVMASGLMGSLSGSAVANTATTGTFTIPLMMRTGFRPHVAAGIEAAASSGGALVPPVMGAGAYMMLELVDPPVTYLTIIRAAILPAILYYLSLFLVVHLIAKREQADQVLANDDSAADADDADDEIVAVAGGLPETRPGRLEGLIFAIALGTLLLLLFMGFTVFRSVSLAMVTIVVLGAVSARTRLGPRKLVAAAVRTSQAGIALIVAAACVGVVLGVVTLTGVGNKLPATILPLAADNLFLALLLLMVSSIVLGMGLPSAVCYLLLATLIGPALGGMGVPPLAAHLFIFYFGLMSMVTPPVALAAYTAASISGSGIMRTAFAAFRYALVGFVLPFLFVYRPALLLIGTDGGAVAPLAVLVALAVSLAGIMALVAAVIGHARHALGMPARLVLAASALVLFAREGLLAIGTTGLSWLDFAAAAIALAVVLRRRPTAIR